MSHCKKFTPNIFNKIKCSNCFRQKEEHSAEALECNRASRSIARSGYLFVAPDWDFSVPLNRTKRWQRRWFVLYDDGELNYSVDEHPDTVPQGSVDMSQVLEVTGAEQVTGHPHSLALTGPDRVTFVKAASREDARWWAELLAVFPRRHKRNATFPGGRASPSLPQLGRSASPQPPRPRHLSCTGPSPRTNFTTPPLKEERESPAKEDSGRTVWPSDIPTIPLPIEQSLPSPRNDYIVSSGSPPTRDKLRCEDKARLRDWRNERLRDIATALTDRSPESSLALPAEGLLNLKKGWLWFKDYNDGEWHRLWWVLCGPTLNAYKMEQDEIEQNIPEVSVELATVTGYSEVQTETRYGFQIQWSGPTLTLSAVTSGIRSNWLKALKKAVPNDESPSTPATPRLTILSSDEEYRTASEGGRRDSEDWGEYNPGSPFAKAVLGRAVKDRSRLRPKLPRCQSRQSTVDSVSTDELDGFNNDDSLIRPNSEIDELRKKLNNATKDVQSLEAEVKRLKALHSESISREKQSNELVHNMEQVERELTQKVRHADEKLAREKITWQRRISEYERDAREADERCTSLSRELQAKQRVVSSLQDELTCASDRLARNRLENDRLYKKLQEIEGKNLNKSKRMASLTDLTDIDLDVDLDTLNQNELIEQCLDLRSRFEKAVLEIRALKRELRDSHVKYDELELENVALKRSLEMSEQESVSQATLMANRVQDLTNKLAQVEKQARSLKSKLQDSREKRRSLSLKGRENFSINREVEDKVTELEAKILSLERGRTRRSKHRRDRSIDAASPIDDKSLRRIRRKSLDSATSSEPMKLLMRLTTLETKVNQVNTSNESLNTLNASSNDLNKTDEITNSISADNILRIARDKVLECQHALGALKGKSRATSPDVDRIEAGLIDLNKILNMTFSESEINVANTSVKSVVEEMKNLLRDKLCALEERKNALRETGQLDHTAKMEIFAEKVAYENLIIGRIQEAINSQTSLESDCERLLNKETVETANLVAKLQLKLTENVPKQAPTCITSIEHLTSVLSKRLLCLSQGGCYPPKNPLKNFNPALDYLEEEQNKLSSLLSVYKTNMLQQIADALAIDTLNLSIDESCRLSDNAINDTWTAARDIVNSELITSEINHILMKTAQKYEGLSSNDQKCFFTFYAYERAILELWSDAVENTLRSEMEKYIEELNELYQSSLIKMQRPTWRRKIETGFNNNSSTLLHEYADIIAHKALIDSRICVLRGECPITNYSGDNTFVMNLFDLESYWDCLENLNLVNVGQNLETEFKFILDKSFYEISSEFHEQDFLEVSHEIKELCSEVAGFESMFGAFNDHEERIYSFKDVCRKCDEIRKRLNKIKENVLILKNKRCDMRDEERRPFSGTEYINQVENMRGAFRKMLAECENRTQQSEFEQLQILCERVLAALEHWHRRTLHELRDSHTQELQALRQDKEQALAEETQATLAALDAMRKAHEAEVQREVARFKLDFAREQQKELLELNEKLSVKCLEAAALQEQLGNTSRKLIQSQQHIHQLERAPQISMQN